jgi:site-specific recombinase XerD
LIATTGVRDLPVAKAAAAANRARLQEWTTSITESIHAIESTKWPRISICEQTKRMQWLHGMFEWLLREKWITDDPAVGLGAEKLQERP